MSPLKYPFGGPARHALRSVVNALSALVRLACGRARHRDASTENQPIAHCLVISHIGGIQGGFSLFFRFPDHSSVSPRASIDQTIQVGDRSSTTPLREREYQFVPSQNDSRWISYGVHAPSMPPAMTYPQNTVAHPQEYYYDPHSGTGQNVQQQQQQQQIPSYSYGVQNHLYANQHHQHQNHHPSYFFDVPDPSLENFQLSQHMMSTSSSRTFLPDDWFCCSVFHPFISTRTHCSNFVLMISCILSIGLGVSTSSNMPCDAWQNYRLLILFKLWVTGTGVGFITFIHHFKFKPALSFFGFKKSYKSHIHFSKFLCHASNGKPVPSVTGTVVPPFLSFSDDVTERISLLLCFLVVDHWLLIKIRIRCGTHLIIRFCVIDVHIPEEENDFQASRVRPSSSDQFNQLCLFCAKFRFWFKHGTAANCVSFASLVQGARGTCVTSHKFVQVVLPQSPSKRQKNRSFKWGG